MKVINFYGGAGIGKSTIAADVFSKLKRKGYKTELVGEYAKWLWYQNATDIVEDQLYLFAEQAHRTRTLEKYGVDFTVCDSPLPLNIIYNREPSDAFDALVMQEFNRYENYNYLLRRNDAFITIDDRKETNLEQAKEKDAQVVAMLEKWKIPYTVISPWETDKVGLDLKVR
ncbi:MAG: AAA family ATPase [Selenomonadaceae bacterium]|nr:AAA family ATPase [Selenomonadaceae bacterium]